MSQNKHIHRNKGQRMKNPYSGLDDKKLMQLYQNGEEMAFEVIYLRHKDRVFSYLSKRMVDKNLVEDTW